MSALRAVAQMLAVKHSLRQSFGAELEQAQRQAYENRHPRRQILRGSRLCGCGRRISGNKAKCLACGGMPAEEVIAC